MKKLILLCWLVSVSAFAATVWVKQSGVFIQEKTAKGSIRYKQIMTVDELAKLQSACGSPVIVTPPQPINYMPIVNQSLIPTGHSGVSESLLIQATHDGVHNENLGAFRTDCHISHFSNDDPIVYPNVKGASHHHTFFGNTGARYDSTPESIRTTGNSSCAGGTLNRTAYWIPSVIDTATGAPLKPFRGIIYYKGGLAIPETIVNFPTGLVMIAGNSLATTESSSMGNFSCWNENTGVVTASTKFIPQCQKSTNSNPTGGFIRTKVEFPQCWDGRNLDSPDHKSHMAYASEWQVDNKGTTNERWYKTKNNCPLSHPVAVPQVTEIFDFEVTDAVNGTNKWRLASDNYSTTQRGGLSLHADWMNGWDEAIMQRIVTHCLNKSIDCGVNYLGDGQALKSIN